MIPLPDLLHSKPQAQSDRDELFAYLELAFLGKDTGGGIERVLGRRTPDGEGWQPSLFASDLFVEDLIRTVFEVRFGDEVFPLNTAYLFQVLSRPPLDLETVRFRQDVIRELDEDEAVRRKTEVLYAELARLLTMFKTPDHVARLDINAHRLEIFRQIRLLVEWMAAEFAEVRSGLRRIHEAGVAIQGTKEYRTLTSLLDYEENFLRLNLDISLGPDGRVRDLAIREVKENVKSPFYRSAWRRFWGRMSLWAWQGTLLSNSEIVNRLLHAVFLEISTPLLTLVELLGPLELYLANLGLRRKAAERGFLTSLAELSDGAVPKVEQAWNPLLLHQATLVPTDVRRRAPQGATLVTGPNSGGKTRLLQTVGLIQVLGQSGLFVPARSAELPVLRGMFVSLIESEAADHAEGRLGREMVRIRSLFEGLDAPAMVILDELCSGTNPSEGTELFSLVLELLDRLGAVALISTHFLDFAQELYEKPPVPGLEFLEVEIDADQRSTYQFLPGVAQTSLAAVTAERLGVTFEQLAELIDRRRHN